MRANNVHSRHTGAHYSGDWEGLVRTITQIALQMSVAGMAVWLHFNKYLHLKITFKSDRKSKVVDVLT